MMQLEGFEDKDQPHLICRLYISLYRLREASREWNKVFDKFSRITL